MRKRIPKAMRTQIWGMYEGRCAYCGKPIKYKDMQVDHIKPVYLGGKDEESNYRPACRMCNFYKSTMTVEKFRSEIEAIPARMLKREFIYRLARNYGQIKAVYKPVTFYFERVAACEPQNEAVGGENE